MKLNHLFLFLLFSLSSFSQDLMDNQIRVVGQYQETLTATKYQLLIPIQEVTSLIDGVKKVVKTMDDVKKDFLTYLKNEKLYTGDLTFVSLNSQNYGNKTSNFSFEISDFDKAHQIVQNTKISGINNITIKYLFDYTDDFLNQLSAKAIDNAKLKAEFMAKKIGKNIGRLLIVDDKTNNEMSLFGPSKLLTKTSDKDSRQEVGYSIFITYELLDK